jgi:hypothetical protein
MRYLSAVYDMREVYECHGYITTTDTFILGMVPVPREITIEESICSGVSHGWEYLSYAIRQLIVLLPCLWAGYDQGRRREKKMNDGKGRDTCQSTMAKNGKYMQLYRDNMDRVSFIEGIRALWGDEAMVLHGWDGLIALEEHLHDEELDI